MTGREPPILNGIILAAGASFVLHYDPPPGRGRFRGHAPRRIRAASTLAAC